MVKMCTCRVVPTTVAEMREGDDGWVMVDTVVIDRHHTVYLRVAGSVAQSKQKYHCVYVRKGCNWYVDVAGAENHKWKSSPITRGTVYRVGTLVC